jgi:hypothetical protein
VRSTAAEELQIEARCGPVIWQSPRCQQFADVRVQVVDCSARTSRCSSPLESKRAIWHDVRRNERIVRLATAFPTGRQSDVIGDASTSAADSLIRSPSSVAVLVESFEHGEELRRLLAEWPLVRRQEPLRARQIRLPDRGDHYLGRGFTDPAAATVAVTARSPVISTLPIC